MENYDAKYVMISIYDLMKSAWFYKIAGLNSTNYLVNHDSVTTFTDSGKLTMILMFLDNRITGFTLVYEDQHI